MFAFVIPGRLVQQTQQVPEAPDRFVASIPEAEALNHVAVFLTGAAPFPEGYGCTIHLETPGKGWQLIGSLSNAKPSAIFRLRGSFIASSSSHASGFTSASSSLAPNAHLMATLGILCEPLEAVQAHVAALGPSKHAEVGTAPSTELVLARNANAMADPVLLAQRVGLNLYNHVGGFAQPLPDGKGSWIELGVIERWYKNFEAKLRNAGVGFLLQDD